MIPARDLRPRETLRVVASPAELASEATAQVLAHARAALAERGAFHLALSGGSTPSGVYRQLARSGDEAAIQRWHVWFGDERRVPPDQPGSNHGLAKESGLLARLPEPSVHRMRGEAFDARAEVARYEQELCAALGAPPRLDLVLLGLGRDGHTASLFPGTPALEAPSWVTVGRAPQPPVERLTLTFATLAHARALVFLVAGSDKAAALTAALDGSVSPPVPARRAYPRDGTLLWLVERSALDLETAPRGP